MALPRYETKEETLETSSDETWLQTAFLTFPSKFNLKVGSRPAWKWRLSRGRSSCYVPGGSTHVDPHCRLHPVVLSQVTSHLARHSLFEEIFWFDFGLFWPHESDKTFDDLL